MDNFKVMASEADIESVEIEPIDVQLAAVKEMTAKWLVDMLLSVGCCVLESQESWMDSMQSLKHMG